jgi:fructokinase
VAEKSREACFHAARVARANGVAVSFDINVRAELWRNYTPETMLEIMDQAIDLADIVKLGFGELEFISQRQLKNYNLAELTVIEETEVHSAVNMVQFHWTNEEIPKKLVLVTDGTGSAMIHNDRMVTSAPVPAEVVDTVGAGDAWLAGLLTWLVRNNKVDVNDLLVADEMRAALHFANRVASYTIERPGAWTSPTMADLGE